MTEISDSVVASYRRSLFHHRSAKTGKPLKFCTQASYLTAVCHWLSWLCDENWLTSNPGADVELPKAEHRFPASYLSLSEVETLLSSPDVTTVVGLRDRSILETFYSTGMRRAELAGLRVDDIDSDRRLIVIRQGKGRKDRVETSSGTQLFGCNALAHDWPPRLPKTVTYESSVPASSRHKVCPCQYLCRVFIAWHAASQRRFVEPSQRRIARVAS